MLSLSFDSVEYLAASLIRQIRESKWIPQLVIGIRKGGVIPAAILSYEFDIPMDTMRIKAYDGRKRLETPEIVEYPISQRFPCRVLIVDDIVDSGGTMQLAKSAITNYFTEVRTASLLIRKIDTVDYLLHRKLAVDYTVQEASNWVVFPWEEENRYRSV